MKNAVKYIYYFPPFFVHASTLISEIHFESLLDIIVDLSYVDGGCCTVSHICWPLASPQWLWDYFI